MTNNDLKSFPTNAAAAIAAGQALGAKPELLKTEGGTLIAFVPNGLEVKDLSGHLAAPTKLKQTVNLETAKDFSDYVNLFGQKARSLIFAAEEAEVFLAALDYHGSPAEPSWCTHKAALKLAHSLEWDKWTERDGQDHAMSQQEFAEFIEDSIADIAEPNGAVLLEIARNFEATKEIEFKSHRRISDGSVQFTYNETVRGGGETARDMILPQELTLALAPYYGMERKAVIAKLRYRIGDGGQLSIWFDLFGYDTERNLAVDLDVTLAEAFLEVRDQIRIQTSGSVRAVLLGTMNNS